ncbi:helicase-exonuclease AddAB subunit AddA [Eubacteriales bacterium OttesenSCG-928-K08]|nr:helicase-exonuclease AddAB subunit AddA [Eubacteriales bacterium OttesenSCG-928-K08]
MSWTDQQRQAIELRDTNLLISAAAGSGKTAVLTERITQLVCEGADIDRFLVVTFTEAATAEMKRRISRNLIEHAKNEESPETAAHLRTQAMKADRANISTLHAFCLYILRRNFHRLELDPAFRPADDIQSDMLFSAALEATADEWHKTKTAQIVELIAAFSGEQQMLIEQVQKLHEFLMSQPDPWAWLKTAADDYKSGIEAHPVALVLLNDLKKQANRLSLLLAGARAKMPKDLTKLCAHLDNELAQIRALPLANGVEEYRARLMALEFKTFSGWPRDGFAELKEQVCAIRDNVKKELNKQKELLSHPLEQENERMAKLLPVVELLCDFVKSVDEIYTASKRENAVVDFSDMEHLALKALEFEDVRETLKKRFLYIFIDEYQDSSRIQERLIELVRRENNLFLVGDVKQSIYRFRQADPSLFLEKLSDYSGGGDGKAIALNINFRSSKPVIDAINDVFSTIMHADDAEIEYDELAALHLPPGATQNQGGLSGVELNLIELNELEPPEVADEDDADDEQERAEVAVAEARLAARRIHELKRTQKLDDGKNRRALKYSDFVVLLRSHRAVGELWARTLAAEGVPAYVQLTGGYFETIEVQVFLNLLRVIDNRRQDIPLLSVLRSPVFNFSEGDLIDIRTACPAEQFNESMREYAKLDTALAGRVNDVFALLDKWSVEARLLPLNELIAKLLEQSRLYECMGALFGGQERQANLDALVARSLDYIHSGAAGDIWSFLRYMDDAADTAKMGAAQAGAADVVRVLSVHKSKGLEYPVVLLGGLNKKFNSSDNKAPLLADRELGLGLRLISSGVKRDTMLRQVILRHRANKDRAEEMRILYVGMTRAKQRLIMIGCARDTKKLISEAKEPSNNVRSFMDWLLPVALQKSCIELKNHQLPRETQSAGAKQETATPDINEYLQAIKERFLWRYGFEDAGRIPTKLSVSGLLHAGEITLRDPPRFDTEQKGLNAAQRGAALHSALYELNLKKFPADDTLAALREETARMQKDGLITKRQLDVLPLKDMCWFLNSPLGKRMLSAKKVERELAFSVEFEANTLLDTLSEETILLQGVIDCCFVEQNGWVLIDYKTDRVQENTSLEEAARTHEKQLELYARALEKLTNIAVKEKNVVLIKARRVCLIKDDGEIIVTT